MASTVDWVTQLSDYRGLLTFPGFATPAQTVTIPLFIKQHPIPVRQPKPVEVTTIPVQLPSATPLWASSSEVVFYGNPDALTLQLQGWVITPTTQITIGGVTARHWNPTYDGSFLGTPLGLTDWSYGDVICGYMEGRLNALSTSLWQQTDPVSYTDPYGRQYSNPIITAFEYDYVAPQKKQPFTMTLWFDKN